MPDIHILLDQNVPCPLISWLRHLKPAWTIHHTSQVGLNSKSDEKIFQWAQSQRSIIITFDEDFADQRSFPVATHAGVIRLRIWPTTVEETKKALKRLFDEVPDEDLTGALVIIDSSKIRVRSPKSSIR